MSNEFFNGLTGFQSTNQPLSRMGNGYDGPKRVLDQLRNLAMSGADSYAVANLALGVANAGLSNSTKNAHPKFAGSHSSFQGQFGSLDGNIPVHTDVWYLRFDETIIPVIKCNEEGYSYIDDEATDRVTSLLAPLVEACGNVSFLKCPMNRSEISATENNGRSVVKAARYECPQAGFGFEFPSRGPRSVSARGKDESESLSYCAYIAFPLGQLVPAIKSISLCVEKITSKMLSSSGWSSEVFTSSGGGFYPPQMPDGLYGLTLMGGHGGFFHQNTEYPAVNSLCHGKEFHQWLRYYFKYTDTFPVPGHFVGLLVGAEATHPWWFQTSSPFLYSGSFFETRFYTSGIVLGVVPEKSKQHNEVGPVYAVNIRGIVVYLQGTDFYEYAVGEEVCILKKSGMSSPGPYSWLDSDDISAMLKSLGDDPSSGAYTLLSLYAIVPVSFYLEGD